MRLFKRGESAEAVRHQVDESQPAPGWNRVGELALPDTGATKHGLARTYELAFTLDRNGAPYIAFFDGDLEVMTYDGHRWRKLGGRDGLVLTSPRIAIDRIGTPYVAAPTHTGGAMQATVLRFDGKKWRSIAQTSGGQVLDLNLQADDAGSVFFAYRDAAHGNLPVVSRFDGTDWHNVGRPGFSAGSGANDLSFALDASGTPWVAFTSYDPYHSGRGSKGAQAVVMTYDGDDWVVVGDRYFSEGYVNQTSIAVDAGGTPYVAFCDGAHGEAATVMRFDGSAWETLGEPGFSAGRVYHVSLAIGGDDVPCVAFSDHAHDKGLTVMRFSGDSWQPLGDAGISAGEASEVHLAVDRSNRLYVAYLDVAARSEPTVLTHRR